METSRTDTARLAALTRKPDRGVTKRAPLDRLLDEALIGTLSTVLDDQPWVVPMLHVRDGNRLLLHGSTGAGALRHISSGAPVAYCVTALDGLVVADSAFASSANYRSAVVRGSARPLAGADRDAALDLVTDGLLPGRTAEIRASTAKERAATLVLELPIADGGWIYKQRSGPPSATEAGSGAWRGVIPLALSAGAPEPAPDSAQAVPRSVIERTARHLAP